MASDVESAIRERLGESAYHLKWLTADEIDDTAVSRMHVPPNFDGHVADFTAAAGTAPLTREIHTTCNYALTHDWALAAAKSGYRGIQYEPRFTNGDRRALALFAKQGAPKPLWSSERLHGFSSLLSSPPVKVISFRAAVILA